MITNRTCFTFLKVTSGLQLRIRNASKMAVPFTSERYNIERKKFAKLTNDDIKFFSNLVGDTGIITDDTQLDAYNVDWQHMCRGKQFNICCT